VHTRAWGLLWRWWQPVSPRLVFDQMAAAVLGIIGGNTSMHLLRACRTEMGDIWVTFWNNLALKNCVIMKQEESCFFCNKPGEHNWKRNAVYCILSVRMRVKDTQTAGKHENSNILWTFGNVLTASHLIILKTVKAYEERVLIIKCVSLSRTTYVWNIFCPNKHSVCFT
jgi:hypothetical protein